MTVNTDAELLAGLRKGIEQGAYTVFDPQRVENFDFHADCRHCVAEGKPCGRAHFEVLRYEWQAEGNRPAPKPEKLASEAQLSYLRKLIAKKDLSDRKRTNRTAKVESGELTAKEASTMIEELAALAWQPYPAQPHTEVTEPGMYEKGGVVYKVQRSKSSGKLYALVLQNGTFDYAPGSMRRLRPEHLMTLEDAKAYGRRTGTCCQCGRTLTNPSSIEAGIGPICATRF